MATAWVSHPDCLKHEMGPYHPEQPARLTQIEQALGAAPFAARLFRIEAPHATRAQLARAHSAAYIDAIHAAAPASGYAYLDPDTSMNPHSLTAALRAAGAGVTAVDRVMAGEVGNAFCAVRPPGHHALRDRAMGFCIFNNVAVSALHALEVHGLARVAIVDFDVHHGNGTEDIFHDDPRVMLVSSFQHPYYPYAGADSGNDHIVPIPLPAGTSGVAFRQQWEAKGLPALERFRPEFVFFSAGFDAHQEDPLAGLRLVEADFAWITERVLAIAQRHASGRAVSVLEGGYDIKALSRSVVAHVGVLASAAS